MSSLLCRPELCLDMLFGAVTSTLKPYHSARAMQAKNRLALNYFSATVCGTREKKPMKYVSLAIAALILIACLAMPDANSSIYVAP